MDGEDTPGKRVKEMAEADGSAAIETVSLMSFSGITDMNCHCCFTLFLAHQVLDESPTRRKQSFHEKASSFSFTKC
ncbi:hypothetical protein F2Q68_00011692 [Brassica cretica]|uniref:Uncharacterized protein n=1 Tax=Brassica cretica TaxID=69181 RepID=A0A8S9L0D2_BRACR|nr:hypothetical protein F2Q68_00011692 [Brassica cretica]